ncbi:MAG: MotA/TolQ/ExbB proton channel family protein, partial [Pirellulaceae bacterium]|nr:MotA/TolQ/ExbB proton channel family protein [Pirellulaceae bacterium]
MFLILGYIIYVCLFLIALWGAFCVVMVWARVKQKRFDNEETQNLFMEAIEEPLSQGNYDVAV